MIINWLPLLCGLFFGLIPPKLLLNSECRYLDLEGLLQRLFPRDKPAQRRRRWWKLPLVWIDPVRGFVAAFLIRDAFSTAPGAAAPQRILCLIATFFILFVMLWVQTARGSKDGECLSPSGFLAGMMLALLPWIVALSAIVIGVTAAVAFSSFGAGYLVAAMVTAVLGFLFLNTSPWLGVDTALVATPMMISWLRRAQMVIPVRC